MRRQQTVRQLHYQYGVVGWRHTLATFAKIECKVEGCEGNVMPSLTQMGLCLDHYLEEAMHHLGQALENCKQGVPVKSEELAHLIQEADFATNYLASPQPGQELSPRRERMLELVLGVANLHEYLRRNVLLVNKPH